MLKQTGIVLTVAAVIAILPGAAMADHIRSRKGPDASATEKLKNRLLELGVTGATADHQIGSLTSKEIAFFAEDTSRVQLVVGLWGEEWVIGGTYLGAVGVVGTALWINAKNEK